MMKVDVLNAFEEIKVCTHYKLKDGSIVDTLPFDIVETDITPIYKTFRGWNKSISDYSNSENLPLELNEYIQYIESELGVPVTLISLGPDRKQTILRNIITA